MTKKLTAKSLAVKLTAAEVKERTGRLLDTLGQIEDLEVEKKETASEYKGRLEGLHREGQTLRRAIATGQEYRMIECEIVRIFDENKIQTIRTDTGEIVEERAMEDWERQAELELDEGAEEVQADEEAGEAAAIAADEELGVGDD